MTALGASPAVDVPPPPWEAQSAPPAPPRLTHEPALDGIRGLAMAVILCYHASILDDLPGLHRWAGGGFLSVSAFFTLSGFLITTLLLLERGAHDRISLRQFWSRRFRRLLPALLLTLAAVAVLAPLVGADAALGGLGGELLSALGYVLNWHSILARSDYAAAFATAESPLKHLWSVSIEEQWYVLLPLLVAGALRLRRGRRDLLAAAFVLLAVGSAALTWGLSGGTYSNRVYLGSDTRLSEMAVGGLLAVLTAGRFGTPLGGDRSPALRRALDVATFGVLVGGLWLWVTADIRGDLPYRGGLTLHAVGVSVVIYAAMHPGTLVNRVLRFRPFTALGKVSYGAYLFHWPILLWLTPERLHVAPAVAPVFQFALTFALAAASYRWYEAPIRVGRRVLRWRRPLLPAAGALAVVLLAVTLPGPDRSHLTALESTDAATTDDLAHSNRLLPAGAVAAAPTTTVAGEPAAPPPPPPVRIMVVGDSFAMSLVPGMRDAAKQRSDFGFLNAALVGCGFGRGGRNRGIGLNVSYSAECRQRDSWIAGALAYYRPDVVVAAGGLWDVTDRKPPGFQRWTHVGDPAYDAYLTGELRHVADLVQSAGASLVWLNAPHWDPVYTPGNFMGRPPYAEADPTRTDRFNELLSSALAGRPKTQLLDLAAFLRSLPGGELARDVRADGVHLTTASTDVVAMWLLPQVIATGQAAPVDPTGSSAPASGDAMLPGGG